MFMGLEEGETVDADDVGNPSRMDLKQNKTRPNKTEGR